MIMATLDITTRVGCSIRCAYCPQELFCSRYAKVNGKAGKRMMSLEDFRACVDKVPRSVQIHFAGLAEPFLNPDCMDMIRYANERGHKFRIYTTLVGIRDITSALDEISSMRNLVELNIHLPSRKEMWIPVDEKYLHGLEVACKRIKPLKVVYFGELDERVREIVKNQQRNGVPLHDRAGALDKDRLAGIGAGITHHRKEGVLACLSYGKRLDHNVLLPNGDVLLCYNDWGIRHVIGNLLSGDYASLFRSEEYKRAIRGLSDPKESLICRDCRFAIERKGIRGWAWHCLLPLRKP
jgi:organic radical activating enzyme